MRLSDLALSQQNSSQNIKYQSLFFPSDRNVQVVLWILNLNVLQNSWLWISPPVNIFISQRNDKICLDLRIEEKNYALLQPLLFCLHFTSRLTYFIFRYCVLNQKDVSAVKIKIKHQSSKFKIKISPPIWRLCVSNLKV